MIGFTRTGEDLGHFHGGFTHAEELHKAGVEAGKVVTERMVRYYKEQLEMAGYIIESFKRSRRWLLHK